MRPGAVERWSLGDSPVHQLDARLKVLVLISLLAAISVRGAHPVWLLFLGFGTILARVPFGRLLLRTAIILPFAGSFALMMWLSGAAAEAWNVLLRSWLSVLAVLLFAATTPMPKVLHAVRAIGVPRALAMTALFVYRFLFVITAEMARMRDAAAARGGMRRFAASSGMVAVLFAASMGRAERVHRAMLARGFAGEIPVLAAASPRIADWTFLAIAAAMIAWPWMIR